MGLYVYLLEKKKIKRLMYREEEVEWCRGIGIEGGRHKGGSLYAYMSTYIWGMGREGVQPQPANQPYSGEI